eukprot:Colp12_sorted_trinity150504_noHs@9762
MRLNFDATMAISDVTNNSAEEVLAYTVDSWSSHSPNYHPKNIMVDKPSEQSSRWSSGSSNQIQYLTLKLEKMSIVKSIKFGKYQKSHVCNMKEFKVYGGLTPNNMMELLHTGLRNDTAPETFDLKIESNGIVFPIRYIKIVPLLAYGPNFNYSIWFVELQGHSDPTLVDKAYARYNGLREQEAIRLCLKHFRQRNYMEAFHSLVERTGIHLEAPVLTELHKKLVVEGDFEACEEIIMLAAAQGLFEDYIASRPYTPEWTLIQPVNKDGQPQADVPGMRGGHQMCIDSEGGMVYLLGGWDGTRDLADFWCFSIAENRWICISENTANQGGPGPRSCHKICFDDVNKRIYTLGRYVDPDSRQLTSLKSDFHCYDVESGTWTLLSNNTQEQGGPDLIYDHQMCIDPLTDSILVFGGRTIPTGTAPDNIYSGLYLYIFAGQRNKDYLSDFYIYNIDTDTVVEMTKDSSKQGGPDAGFTQRATIDTESNEVYVLSGLMKDKTTQAESVKNSFWVYNIARAVWSCVYQNDRVDPEYWQRMQGVEPPPRFAHQLVYDTKNKVHYLFGGNPGETSNPRLRLDDFWALRLRKPSAEQIVQRCRFYIRKQKFTEMCAHDSASSLHALHFLQTELAATVNHSDPSESAEFRALTANLFRHSSPSAEGGEHDKWAQRSKLYEELLQQFFPESMAQPKQNLVDLISFN